MSFSGRTKKKYRLNMKHPNIHYMYMCMRVPERKQVFFFQRLMSSKITVYYKKNPYQISARYL